MHPGPVIVAMPSVVAYSRPSVLVTSGMARGSRRRLAVLAAQSCVETTQRTPGACS